MKNHPSVYVILVNWNGLRDTIACLDSLKKINYKNTKIILVDNGSQNNQSKIIKKTFPNIHLIENRYNVGYCKANNQGARFALQKGAKYILFLNNDTAVKPNFLNILVDYAKKNNYKGVLTPKILFFKKSIVWAFGGNVSRTTSIPHMIGQGKPSSLYNKIINPDYASGCAFLVNTSVLKKVGLFDEIYFAYYEDTDLSFRIRKNGYNISAIPDSIIWHKVSRSTNPKTTDKINEIQSYYLSRNGIIFGDKNLNGVNKLIYILLQTFIKLPAYVFLKCSRLKSKMAYIKGYRDGIKYIINNQ